MSLPPQQSGTALDSRPTVLITGATSGIGRATALHLAERGYVVFATGRDPDRVPTSVSEGGQIGQLIALALDVTDSESIRRAHDAVLRHTNGQGLDVLINNAGYSQPGPLELMPDTDLRAQFDINVFGLMAVTRAFVGDMRRRGGGRVINISSIAGELGYPIGGPYCASKHAVEALSDALRCELWQFGIRVVLIQPGPIHTPFFDKTIAATELLAQRNVDSDGAYAAALERNAEILRHYGDSSPGPKVVARAVERAIQSRRPRARYVVPWLSRVELKLYHLMPTWLTDRLIIRLFRPRKQVKDAGPSPAKPVDRVASSG